jgi:hypothetical protein
MEPKLTMLFLLIGTIISLSHANRENIPKMKRWFAGLHLRIAMLRRPNSH